MQSSGFEQFGFSTKLLRGIEATQWKEPRPIQLKAIPQALEGKDVLGLAPTGTGKTAAFALPILEALLSEPNRKPGLPKALIIAPTRELAIQIGESFKTLATFTQMKVAVVIGGVSVHSQKMAMRGRPEIIVGCPGRMLDLQQQGILKLHRVKTLVMDEADHMFDMGFLPDIRRILSKLPEDRQNLLFSATMPKEVRQLADDLLNDPFVVESDRKPVSTVEHSLYPIQDHKAKASLLKELLRVEGIASAIIFTKTKHKARKLADQLHKQGHNAVALQGNMSQNARERAMNGFRKGKFDILVATDIAARGIDVQQVTHVINYDMPDTPDAYVHRIGRTGRAEREGSAYTFIVPADHYTVRQVERRLGRPIERRVVSEELQNRKSAAGPNGSARESSDGSVAPSRRFKPHRPSSPSRRKRSSKKVRSKNGTGRQRGNQKSSSYKTA